MDCCLLKTSSVWNKTAVVNEYVIEQGIDILMLIETWLKPGDSDAPNIGYQQLKGYKLSHEPRSHNKKVVVLVYFTEQIVI